MLKHCLWSIFLFAIILPVCAEVSLSDVQTIIFDQKSAAETYDYEAAVCLQEYVQKMSGHSPSLNGQANAGNAVYLGKSALDAGIVKASEVEALGVDGFILRITRNGIGVAGKNGGVFHGTMELLRQFGLKYYAFQCESFPDTPLRVKEKTVSRQPSCQMSIFNGWFGNFYHLRPIGFMKLGFSPDMTAEKKSTAPYTAWGYGETDLTVYHRHHTTLSFIPRFLTKSHPEYFARDKNGRVLADLYPKESYQLCLSNPEVKKIVTERMRMWMKNTPIGVFYQLSQGDQDHWCECGECAKMDKGVPWNLACASMSDRWHTFIYDIVDTLLKEFPEKKIITYAYCATEKAPKVPPHPALGIMFCPYDAGGGAACQTHDLKCPDNKAFMKNYQDWLKLCPDNDRYVFEYPCGANPYLPHFTLDAMNRKMKFYGHKLRGIVYCSISPMFTELFLYQQSALVWDPALPDSELEKSEDDFLKHYYGNAASGMKEFLSLIRSNLPCRAGSGTRSTLLSKEFAEKAYEIFERAEKSVEGKPPFLKRVQYEKLAGLVYGDFVQDTAAGNELWRRLKAFRELCRLTRATGTERFEVSIPQLAMDKVNLVISGGKWYDSPSLKEMYDCRTDEDYKRLAGKLGIGIFRNGYVKTTPEEFIVMPYEDRNRKFKDVEGVERRPFLLQGEESIPVKLIYDKDGFPGGEIILEGLDHDKEGAVPFKIQINGETVFAGNNTFEKEKWTQMRIPLRKDILKKGINAFRLSNEAKTGFQKNWLMFSEIRIAPSSSKFRKVYEEDYSTGSTFTNIAPSEQNSARIKISTDKDVSFEGKPTLKIHVTRSPDAETARSRIGVGRRTPASILKESPARRKYIVAMKASKAATVALAMRGMKEGHPGYIIQNPLRLNTNWQVFEFPFRVKKYYGAETFEFLSLHLGENPGETTFWISPVAIEEEIE